MVFCVCQLTNVVPGCVIRSSAFWWRWGSPTLPSAAQMHLNHHFLALHSNCDFNKELSNGLVRWFGISFCEWDWQELGPLILEKKELGKQRMDLSKYQSCHEEESQISSMTFNTCLTPLSKLTKSEFSHFCKKSLLQRKINLETNYVTMQNTSIQIWFDRVK